MARLKSLSIVVTLVLAGALTISLTAQGGPFRGHADLSGFQENPTLSTPARGTIDVDISRDGQSMSYTLTYSGFNTNVRFAHIHIGRPAINGGVMVFLCTNETPPVGVPTPPPCPQNGGTVTGTLAGANVLAVTAQGVVAGDFAEVVDALRADAAYANVHSVTFGAGEIRGQIAFNNGNTQGSQGNQN